MSDHQETTTTTIRGCERCRCERVEYTKGDARPNFAGWHELQTAALFGRFASLGRGPYTLCPDCTEQLVAWWPAAGREGAPA